MNTWITNPVSVEEDGYIVSYLGHNNGIYAGIDSLILISGQAVIESTYVSISAFQHYFYKIFKGLS